MTKKIVNVKASKDGKVAHQRVIEVPETGKPSIGRSDLNPTRSTVSGDRPYKYEKIQEIDEASSMDRDFTNKMMLWAEDKGYLALSPPSFTLHSDGVQEITFNSVMVEGEETVTVGFQPEYEFWLDSKDNPVAQRLNALLETGSSQEDAAAMAVIDSIAENHPEQLGFVEEIDLDWDGEVATIHLSAKSTMVFLDDEEKDEFLQATGITFPENPADAPDGCSFSFYREDY